MRKIKSIARLAYVEKLSVRAIARSLDVSRDSVQTTLDRLALAGLGSWPLPDEFDDEELEARLYPSTDTPTLARKLTDDDCAEIESRMAKMKWDLTNAHSDHVQRTGSTIAYSYFCELMRKSRNKRSISMRQVHHAGDAVYVDFSGTRGKVQTALLTDPIEVEIFVGTLGYSQYFYAEAVPSQKKQHWVMAHVRMFDFFGGVPSSIVCDNLKAAVIKPSRHAPVINESYLDLAEHYRCTIVPARVRKPQDKSVVENSVKVVRRWILMRLHGRVFDTIDALNMEIQRLLAEANARPFQKTQGSRLSRFLEVDKPALKPLPSEPYEYKEFRTAQVSPQYHFEVANSRYSVPFEFANRVVDLIISERSITALHKGRRIAVHAVPLARTDVTVAAHMPPNHQYIHLWKAEDALARAASVGPCTRAFLEASMAVQSHPVQQRRLDMSTAE